MIGTLPQGRSFRKSKTRGNLKAEWDSTFVGVLTVPSIRSRLFKGFFRWRNSRLPLDRPIHDQRNSLDARGGKLPMDPAIQAMPVDAFGVPAEWLDARDTRSDRALLYLHGGGYFIGSCRSHRGFVSHLASACRARALLPGYRLAPEDPFPAGLLDARAAYRFLLAQGYPPERIVVGGESSGGGLALALLFTLRDEHMQLPAAAVLLSPWTDLLGTGGSVRTRARRDPWLRPAGIELLANRYRNGTPTDHPLVSPLYGDMHGLPPLLIHAGNDEIILDDSTRLAEKATAAGVDVTLKVWQGLWHAFHAFYPWVPEARHAHREIGEWVAAAVSRGFTNDTISRGTQRRRSAPVGGAAQSGPATAFPGGRLDRLPDRQPYGKLAASG